MLKSADICAAEPQRVAQLLVERGITERFDHALDSLTELPFISWREYDPEDTLRFYALRLHESGMIASTPNQILADGTDWRFLNELKQELKPNKNALGATVPAGAPMVDWLPLDNHLLRPQRAGVD